MQMKKIVSIAAAAAMAAAFCVPTYAATPGEVAKGTADNVLSLTASNWATNKAEGSAAMEELTSQVRADSSITVTQVMNNAGLSFFDICESTKDEDIAKVVGVEEYSGLEVVYRKAADASDLTVNSFGYNDKGVITMDVTEGSTPSKYGYAVTVMLPAESDVYYYNVSIQNGQLIDVTVPVTAYVDKDGTTRKMVTFWAPHFTTYELTPMSLNQNQGGEQQTVTSDDSSSSSSDESTAASTTTATTATVAENPIKATGVSMNLSVFAVVACAAVAACGAGVAVKKSHKGE